MTFRAAGMVGIAGLLVMAARPGAAQAGGKRGGYGGATQRLALWVNSSLVGPVKSVQGLGSGTDPNTLNASTVFQTGQPGQTGATKSLVVSLPFPVESKAVIDWLKSAVESSAKSHAVGAIDVLDYSNASVARVNWTDGVITEAKLPEIAADSKVAPTLALSILAKNVSFQKGDNKPVSTGSVKQRQFVIGNVRLEIDGLPTQHVVSIAPYTLVPHGACSPLTITFDAKDLSAYRSADVHAHRNGSLAVLSPDNKILFGLSWKGLQIANVTSENVRVNNDNVTRAKATFACDRVDIAPNIDTSA